MEGKTSGQGKEEKENIQDKYMYQVKEAEATDPKILQPGDRTDRAHTQVLRSSHFLEGEKIPVKDPLSMFLHNTFNPLFSRNPHLLFFRRLVARHRSTDEGDILMQLDIVGLLLLQLKEELLLQVDRQLHHLFNFSLLNRIITNVLVLKLQN